MYVLGGIERDEQGTGITVSSVLKFECRLQTWSEVAPMPEERDFAGACVLGSDIYIFGGRSDEMEETSTTYRFSAETNEWMTLTAMPVAKSHHSVTVLDGLIYVLGGGDSDGIAVGSVHRFDPVANLWSAVAPMSVARWALGSFVLRGIIYAVGGFDKVDLLSSMERYSVASDSWSEVVDKELGTARISFVAAGVRLEVDLFDSLIAKAKSVCL
jgi:hypothetical protein